MAVAHGNATKSATWTTTPDPFTFDHTPSATPRGAIVIVAVSGATTDQITGITYGGTAMSRVQFAIDTVGEPVSSYFYFLGASIPTGLQTVSIDHDATAGTKVAWAITLTAAADTEVKASNILQGDQGNPQIALNSGSASALRYCGIGSGLNAPTDLTIIGGMSTIDNHDYGTKSARIDRETSPSSGSTTIGYTGASDDVAMAAAAIGEAEFTPVVNAYRFYEDGTESGSSPIDAQDTDISRNVDSNSQVHLRYRIDETGGVAGAATDDYQLQYSKNAGAYADVTAASSNVQADTGSTLTDGGATTDRAVNGISNPGAGSFVAGIQEEGDGAILNWQLTASNFTEHAWALLLISADLADSDTLDFRVTLNGGTPGMTNNVTPTVTATKTPPPASGVGWFYPASKGGWW